MGAELTKPTSHSLCSIPNSTGNDRFAPFAPVLSHPLVRISWVVNILAKIDVLDGGSKGAHGERKIQVPRKMESVSGFTANCGLVLFRQLLHALEVMGILSHQDALLENSLFFLKPVRFAEAGNLVQEVRLCDAGQGVDDPVAIVSDAPFATLEQQPLTSH